MLSYMFRVHRTVNCHFKKRVHSVWLDVYKIWILSLSPLSLSLLHMIAGFFYMWRRSPHIPSDPTLPQRSWRNSWMPRRPPNRSVAPCRAALRSWVVTRGSATTSKPTMPPTRTLSVAAVTGASKGQSGDPHNTHSPIITRGRGSRECCQRLPVEQQKMTSKLLFNRWALAGTHSGMKQLTH